MQKGSKRVSNMQITDFLRKKIIQDLIEIDQTRQPENIFKVVASCVFKYYMSLQAIEQTLRNNHCFTYLIARKRRGSHGENVVYMMPPETVKTYYLWVSIQDPADVSRKILKDSTSYEKNFEKLADTGFYKEISSKKPSSPLEITAGCSPAEPVEMKWYSIAKRKKTDITIAECPLHKEILAYASDYFRAKCAALWKPEEICSLDFSELPLSSDQKTLFKIICEWLYTGKLPDHQDDWLDIYTIADYLQIKPLKHQCEAFLCEDINETTANDYLIHYHQSPRFQKLKEQVMAFIVITFSEEKWNSFLKNLEDKTLQEELCAFGQFHKSSEEDIAIIRNGWNWIKNSSGCLDPRVNKLSQCNEEILLVKFRDFDLLFFVDFYRALQNLNFPKLDLLISALNHQLMEYVSLRCLFSVKRKLCIQIEDYTARDSNKVKDEIKPYIEIFSPFRNFLINKQKEAIQQYPYIFQQLLNPKKHSLRSDLLSGSGGKKECLSVFAWHYRYQEEIKILKRALLNEKEKQTYHPHWDKQRGKPASPGDLIIEVSGETFEAHQLICREMIFIDDSKTQKMEFSPELFPKFLEFLYTGTICSLSDIGLNQIDKLLTYTITILKEQPSCLSFIQCIDAHLCPLIKDLGQAQRKPQLSQIELERIKTSYSEAEKIAQKHPLSKSQSLFMNQYIRQALQEKKLNPNLFIELIHKFPWVDEINLSNCTDFHFSDLKFLGQCKNLRTLKLRSCPWVNSQTLAMISHLCLEELDIAFTPASSYGIVLPLGYSLPGVKKLIMGISSGDIHSRNPALLKAQFDLLFCNFPNLIFLEYYVPYEITIDFEETLYQTLCKETRSLSRLHLNLDCIRDLDAMPYAFFKDQNHFFEKHPEFEFTYDQMRKGIFFQLVGASTGC